MCNTLYVSAGSPNWSTEFGAWSHAIIKSVYYTRLDIQLQQPASKQEHGDLRVVAAFDFMYSMCRFGLNFSSVSCCRPETIVERHVRELETATLSCLSRRHLLL